MNKLSSTIPQNTTQLSASATTPLWVVAGLSMGPLVALGLARFAYALLLPAMRADLEWSYAQAGMMNAVNALGYLLGALVAAPVISRLGPRISFVAGLVVTALTLLASGGTATFTVLLVWRTVAGIAGAVAFVAGGGLAAASGAGGGKGRAPLALGVYFAGAGLGVVVSALIVPTLLEAFGWRGGWIGLGALSLVAVAVAWPALARSPSPTDRRDGAAKTGWSALAMLPVLVSYVLYGAGYIAYATFVVAYLRSDRGFSAAEITGFWSVMGVSAMVGGFAWGPVLGRARAGRGIAITTGVVCFAVILLLATSGHTGTYVSAVLFGGAFLAVVAAVVAFIRRATPPEAWTAAIGTATVAFALGQCVGPLVSGLVADGAHGVQAGLWLSCAILAGSVVCAAMQRERR